MTIQLPGSGSIPTTTVVSVHGGIPVWVHPMVTLLSRPTFEEPPALRVTQHQPGTQGAQLVEFAGRVCYMSQNNISDKSTAEYINNIIDQGHGSVLEHANYSMLFEGVSRSLTHELVRHRAGFAYSQLSQRYVSPEHLAFVMPMELLHTEGFESVSDMANEQSDFYEVVADVRIVYMNWLSKFERNAKQFQAHLASTDMKKVVRQSGRFVLPNCTETKIVVTANARAWRHFLVTRGGAKADPEIRRLAVTAFRVMFMAAPEFLYGLYEGNDFELPSYSSFIGVHTGAKV